MNFRNSVLALAVFLGGYGAAWAQGTAAPPSKEPFAGAPKVIPLSLEERLGFAQRVRQALERTRGVKVVYQDILGEGPGAWDPDPRYPSDTVNCITWLQLLMAEVYGNSPQEKETILDRVRYKVGKLFEHEVDSPQTAQPKQQP